MGAAVLGGATAVVVESESSRRGFCTDVGTCERPTRAVLSARNAVLEVTVLYLLEIRGPGRGARGGLGSDLLELGSEVL